MSEERFDESGDLARCVHCDCTDDDPCPGGCWWVPMEISGLMEDVCSSCVGGEAAS